MAMTEISAGGVVYYREDGQIYILLIADPRGRWSFPKGLVGRGETPEQAALREIAEETGVAGRIEASLGPSRYVYRRGGVLINKTVHFFLVAAMTREVRPQLEEVSDARWFPAGAALAASAFPANTRLLEDALRRLGGHDSEST